jgi:hypothetical protein
MEKVRLLVTREGLNDVMTLEIQLKAGVPPTEGLRAAIEERLREVTKLRGSTVFVAEIPDGAKKVDDRRKW